MKKIVLAALLLSVFLSGCTIFGGGTSGSGAASGVIIKSFTPDISEVYPGDDVVFTASVENVGGEDATAVTAKLYGLGSDWRFSSGYQASPMELTRSQTDMPGGSDDFVWTATAPEGLKTDQTYTAMTRVKYAYTTTAVASIKVYNSGYLRTRPDEASAISKSAGIDSLRVTDAPLTISLSGVARPIIYRESGQTYTVSALISNVGQGYPFKDVVNDDSDENNMGITITSMTVADKACTGQTFPADVRLPRGGTKAFSCRFTVPDVSEYTTIPVEIVVNYNYFVDSSAMVTVLAEVV
jgi:hypothetical protein